MIKTPLCELLGIEAPIIQGGMAWVADADLAAAVSNAGGLGLISAMNADAEWLRNQIRKAKSMTNRPFGVNIMLMSPHVDDVAQVVLDERVPVVTTGAGNPGKYITAWKEAGIKVLPVVAAVALAKRLSRYHVDAFIAEGTESGGHVGEMTTMALVPQVVDVVETIPVIAAGGIMDGRGLMAAVCLGAKGVQLGTAFLTCAESGAQDVHKEAVLHANENDTTLTRSFSGKWARGIHNRFTEVMQKHEAGLPEFPVQNTLTQDIRKVSSANENPDYLSLWSGQSPRLARSLSAESLIKAILSEAEEIKRTQ